MQKNYNSAKNQIPLILERAQEARIHGQCSFMTSQHAHNSTKDPSLLQKHTLHRSFSTSSTACPAGCLPSAHPLPIPATHAARMHKEQHRAHKAPLQPDNGGVLHKGTRYHQYDGGGGGRSSTPKESGERGWVGFTLCCHTSLVCNCLSHFSWSGLQAPRHGLSAFLSFSWWRVLDVQGRTSSQPGKAWSW